MQSNNYGLLVKTMKKIAKITKSAVQLKELPFTLQHGREFVMFRFYFPLFIKLFAVLLYFMCNL